MVLDASAILALAFDEPGAQRVREALPVSCISSVNLSEAVAKMLIRGTPEAAARSALEALAVPVVAFDSNLAYAVAALAVRTRRTGISFADRACLALSAARSATALTADRTWATVDLGVEVELIR